MCEFCEYKRIYPQYGGAGSKTMGLMLRMLGGIDEDYNDGIRLDSEENILWFDNSDGEYAELGIDIQYCPLCGKRLNTADTPQPDYSWGEPNEADT